jgi:hypothetical protein
MGRAVIAIGVNQAGELPRLNTAADSALQVGAWAEIQGLECEVITDTQEAVTIDRIWTAVNKRVSAGTYEQLVIYFSGHGVNIGYREYWLLSGAPERPQEAVNLEDSVELARYCGIPHVVFISDACRSAAMGTQAQAITGSPIFPNEGRGGQELAVDQFFACTLGSPALEVQDPRDAANAFSSIYTKALLRALKGQNAAVIDWDVVTGSTGYVRPRPLKRVLASEVPAQIADLGLHFSVYQLPDARIVSDEDAWLAKLNQPVVSVMRTPLLVEAAQHPMPPVPLTPAELCARLIAAAIDGQEAFRRAMADLRQDQVLRIGAVLDEVQWLATPFVTLAPATGCGYVVRGAQLVDACAYGAHVRRDDGETAEVDDAAPAGTEVLLVFAHGRAALLPALPGFVCGLSFDNVGDLVSVEYEPCAGTPEWDAFQPHAALLRSVRAVAAAASHWGPVHLDPEVSAQLALRAAVEPLDPAVVVYLAYANRGPDWVRRVLEPLDDAMVARLHASFLDVAMRAGRLKKSNIAQPTYPILSPFPLRVAGWAAMSALGVELPAPLANLREALTSSPWTLFEEPAIETLRHYICNGGNP